MSKKKRKRHPADRPATRRYVQSVARRLKAEMLRAQEAEIAAVLGQTTLADWPPTFTKPPATFYMRPPGGGSVTKTKRGVSA